VNIAETSKDLIIGAEISNGTNNKIGITFKLDGSLISGRYKEYSINDNNPTKTYPNIIISKKVLTESSTSVGTLSKSVSLDDILEQVTLTTGYEANLSSVLYSHTVTGIGTSRSLTSRSLSTNVIDSELRTDILINTAISLTSKAIQGAQASKTNYKIPNSGNITFTSGYLIGSKFNEITDVETCTGPIDVSTSIKGWRGSAEKLQRDIVTQEEIEAGGTGIFTDYDLYYMTSKTENVYTIDDSEYEIPSTLYIAGSTEYKFTNRTYADLYTKGSNVVYNDNAVVGRTYYKRGNSIRVYDTDKILYYPGTETVKSSNSLVAGTTYYERDESNYIYGISSERATSYCKLTPTATKKILNTIGTPDYGTRVYTKSDNTYTLLYDTPQTGGTEYYTATDKTVVDDSTIDVYKLKWLRRLLLWNRMFVLMLIKLSIF